MSERIAKLAMQLQSLPLPSMPPPGNIQATLDAAMERATIEEAARHLADVMSAGGDWQSKKERLEECQKTVVSLGEVRGKDNPHFKLMRAICAIALANAEGRPEPTDKELGLSQCFIATAACGSPFEPDVVRLRELRDVVLCRTVWGRVLICTYDTIGPHIATAISHSCVARALVRRTLVRPLRMVADLLLRTGKKP